MAEQPEQIKKVLEDLIERVRATLKHAKAPATRKIVAVERHP